MADAGDDGYHWRDGWMFKRMPDGSVRIRKYREQEPRIVEAIIPPFEWASIVAAVSARGESGRTHTEAGLVHNETG